MRFPGFSAETSLYKTSGHYRMIAKFDQADGAIYPTLSINDLFKSSIDSIDIVVKSLRDFSDFIYVDRPFPTAIPCGGLGKACCRAPTASQNVPAFGPLVSCQQGLGCDITTNKCVSTCGGPGQVCCDGPETRALKWTADGKIYSPNYWNMREMCDSGVCDKQTHRCITCGTHDGGPCCSSDAAQATARCMSRFLECEYDPWGFYESGTCHACGTKDKRPCEWGCDTGLDLRSGLCDICGNIGQIPCDHGCNGGLWLKNGLCDRPPPPPNHFSGAAGGGSSGTHCPPGTIFCGGRCVTSDPQNCGRCGNVCPQGTVCEGQQCVADTTCAAVDGACVADTQPGVHCCRNGPKPLTCNYKKCVPCIRTGEVCPDFSPKQICCDKGPGFNYTCILDPNSGKAVCGVPDT